MYHAKYTDILTANASLYIVGDWTTANGHCSYFERELLLNGPLMSCLEKAVEDKEETSLEVMANGVSIDTAVVGFNKNSKLYAVDNSVNRKETLYD